MSMVQQCYKFLFYSLWHWRKCGWKLLVDLVMSVWNVSFSFRYVLVFLDRAGSISFHQHTAPNSNECQCRVAQKPRSCFLFSGEVVVAGNREGVCHGKILGCRDSLFTSSRSTPRGRGLLRPHSFDLTSLSLVFFMNERIQPQRAAE